MIISLTFSNYPIKFISEHEFYKHNQSPNMAYIQNELDYIPDYTHMKYNGQKYLYVFLFYDYTEYSQLKDILLSSFNEDDIFSFYEKNQLAILSNKSIPDYDNETELFTGDFLGGDDTGGDLTCAILRN